MSFEIHSHRGVGKIRFGMAPSEVREALGVGFESFRRSQQSVHSCDYFTELECFVYYDDKNGLVDAVEFADLQSRR